MGKRAVLLMLAAALVFCPGCWNYREINSTTFVAGAAIDLDPQGGYILTAEIIDFTSTTLDSAPRASLVTARGASIAEAADAAVRSAGKRLYWSHAAAFIVSRGFAEAGIEPLLDFLLHNVDTCLVASLLVSGLPTAREVFELRHVSRGTVSYEIRSVLENNAFFSQSVADFAYASIRDFMTSGACAALSLVSSCEQSGEHYLDVSGCAVFDGTRMAGTLDGAETTLLLALRGQQLGSTLSVTLPDGTPYTLRFVHTRVDRAPALTEDGRLRMNVTLYADMVVTSAGTLGRRMESSVYRALERAAEERVTAELSAMARRTQELGLDLFGFGELFRDRLPRRFSETDDWNAEFRTLEIVTASDVSITKSSAGPAILTPDG